MDRIHWQGWAMITIGLAILLSPFALTYVLPAGLSLRTLTITLMLTGTAVMALGGLCTLSHQTWPPLLSLLLGGWVAVMPWIIGFAGVPVLTWGAVAAGLLLMLLSGLTLREAANGQHV